MLVSAFYIIDKNWFELPSIDWKQRYCFITAMPINSSASHKLLIILPTHFFSFTNSEEYFIWTLIKHLKIKVYSESLESLRLILQIFHNPDLKLVASQRLSRTEHYQITGFVWNLRREEEARQCHNVGWITGLSSWNTDFF